MSAFIHDDFVLQSQAAKELYHNFAKGEPILDFHNHLPPDEIAANRSFETLYDIWLAGDHYKWRAMEIDDIRTLYENDVRFLSQFSKSI